MCIRDRDWAPFCARMTDLAAMLADEGLTLCYHHHMGTIVETREDIARFMEGCGAQVNLLLDTGPVSYTHLDVYKRQPLWWFWACATRRRFR